MILALQQRKEERSHAAEVWIRVGFTVTGTFIQAGDHDRFVALGASSRRLRFILFSTPSPRIDKLHRMLASFWVWENSNILLNSKSIVSVLGTCSERKILSSH